MGLSHVTAAALVYAGVTFTAFGITTDLFDRDADADAAWRDARALDEAVARTNITITAVTADGGTVTVHATNDGATTLDLGEVTLLFDGDPVTVASRNVEQQQSEVWAPLTDAQLNVTAALPGSVAMATEHGVRAYWRG